MISLWMLACGGKASDIGNTPPSSGGSSAGGASAAGGNGSGGAGAGGPGDSCESFDDEQAQHLPIVISNQTSVPIYVGPFTEGGCSSTAPPFSIQQDGRYLALSEGCSATCAQLRDQEYQGCPTICRVPETIELAPGDEHAIDWSGLIFTRRTLPVECVRAVDGPQKDEQCRQLIAITPGTYTFGALAGTELICPDWALPEECDSCDAMSSGGCVRFGPYAGGETLRAETVVELGPAHGLGGSDAETGAIAPIEIVFTD